MLHVCELCFVFYGYGHHRDLHVLTHSSPTRRSSDLSTLLPDPAAAWCAAPRPVITNADYEARLARVLDYIRAGDIYQANLTFAAEVAIVGDPIALYARLRGQARAHYGAVVRTADTLLLSLCPELFFRLDGDPRKSEEHTSELQELM